MSENLSILVNVVDNATAGLKRINEGIRQVSSNTNRAAKVMRKNFVSAIDANKKAALQADKDIQKSIVQRLKTQQNSLKASKQAFSEWFGRIQNGLLGIGLSILFTGMALKRMTDSALRAIITTMQQVTGDTHEFSVLTNRLSANWEFFKFTLVDALMQSGLFQIFIEGLISVLGWLQNLSPATKRWMVIFLVAGSVIGAVMMVVGQALLFLLAPLALLQLAGVETFGALALKATAFLTGLVSFLVILGIIGAAVIILREIWKSEMSTLNKIIYTVITALLALAGVFTTLGMTGLAVIMLKLAAFAALIAVALAFKEELGIVFGFIIQGFLEIGDLIVEALLLPMRASLWAAGKLAEILGMEKAQRGIQKVSDTIDAMREGIDGLKEASKGRISTLIEQRENRDPFMERTGLNSLLGKAKEFKDGFGNRKPDTPAEDNVFLPDTGGDSSKYFDQKFEFNVSQQPGEDQEDFVNRMMEEFEDRINREVPSTQGA